MLRSLLSFSLVFFFNNTAPPEIYTLSLHDALPISWLEGSETVGLTLLPSASYCLATEEQIATITILDNDVPGLVVEDGDRKSTRLNSSHRCISYAVFCLKKKIKQHRNQRLSSKL